MFFDEPIDFRWGFSLEICPLIDARREFRQRKREKTGASRLTSRLRLNGGEKVTENVEMFVRSTVMFVDKFDNELICSI